MKKIRIRSKSGKTTLPAGGNLTGSEIATRERASEFYAAGMNLPNPDAVLKKLGKDIEVYEELTSDPRVGSNMESRMAGATSGVWEIKQGTAEKKVTELISEVFTDLPVKTIMTQMHNAVGYGYQPMEIIWERGGSKTVPAKIIDRPPEWFRFDSDGNLRLLTDDAPVDGINLSDDEYQYRFLLPRNRPTYNNPYGVAVFSRVFWYVAFKKGGMKLWTKFIEKYGMPWPVGKYRNGASQDEIETMEEALVKMVQDAIAVIPEGNSVDILNQSTKNSESLFGTYLEYCDSAITIAILGHNGISESQAGKLGSENEALEVKADRVAMDRDIITEEFNKLIRMIVNVNFGEHVTAPEFAFKDKEEVQKEKADRDETLSKTGVIFTKKYFQNNYGLKEDEFDLSRRPDSSRRPDPNNFAAPRTDDVPRRHEPEGFQLIDRNLSLFNHNDTIEAIRLMTERATTPEELQEMLLNNFASIPGNNFRKDLEQALIAINLAGRHDVETSVHRVSQGGK